MKKNTLLILIILSCLISGYVYPESKAEANRIKFAKKKANKELKGSLSSDEEMEYVFGAKKGQTVYITNSDSDKFAYRLLTEDGVNKDSTELAEPTMEFVIPKTGDYMLFVRRANKKPKTAKFSITIAIN
jgi:hypothetical protein